MKQHAAAAVLLVLVTSLPGSTFATPRAQSRAPRSHKGHHVHDKRHIGEVELRRVRLELAKKSQAFLKQRRRAEVLEAKVHKLEADLSIEQEKEKQLQGKLDRVRAVVEGNDSQGTVPFNITTQHQNSTAVRLVREAQKSTNHMHHVKLKHGRLSHSAEVAFNKRHQQKHSAAHTLRSKQKRRVPSEPVHVRLVKEQPVPSRRAQVRVHLSHSEVNSTAAQHFVKGKFQSTSHRPRNVVHVAKAQRDGKVVDEQTEALADAAPDSSNMMYANLTADIGQLVDGELVLHDTNQSTGLQEMDTQSSDFDDYDKQVEAAWHEVQLEDAKGDSSSGIIKTANLNGFHHSKHAVSKDKVHFTKRTLQTASIHAASEKKENYNSQVEAAWKQVEASDKSIRVPGPSKKHVVMPAIKTAAAHRQPASAAKQVPKSIEANAVNVSNASQITDTSDFDSDAILRTYGNVQSIDDVESKLQEEDQKINQLDGEANSTQLSSSIAGLVNSAAMSDEADEVGSPLLTLSPEEAAMTADSKGGGGDEQFLSQLMSGRSDTDSHV